jgi:hypothetical protein
MFTSVIGTNVAIYSSVFTDSRVQTGCASSSSQTFSLGGGISIFRAGSVVLNETNVTNCRAIGVRQANNVLVGGGGSYVQGAESVTLESSFVSACSVEDAFSVLVLPCGGGAIGITNISAVQISNSNVYNNSGCRTFSPPISPNYSPSSPLAGEEVPHPQPGGWDLWYHIPSQGGLGNEVPHPQPGALGVGGTTSPARVLEGEVLFPPLGQLWTTWRSKGKIAHTQFYEKENPEIQTKFCIY